MDIEISQKQGRVPVTVVRVTGRVNLGSVEQLQHSAQKAIESGARNVLLDLSGVESITSAGLRTIHSIYKMLAGASPGGDTAAATSDLKSKHLKLLRPSTPVRRVIEIAGFDKFLEIQDDLDEAVASF